MKDIKRFNPPKKDLAFHKRFFNGFSFNLRLIFKNIMNKKRNTIIIILGLVFSLSILYTASIWSLTSQKIIADDYIETLDYEMYVQSFLNDIDAYEEVYDYVNQDPFVSQVDWIFPAVALFNYEDKADTYRWYPEDDQEDMENPLSLSNGFVITNRAMKRIALNLNIEGNSSLQSGEILVSYTQAKQLEEIYNETISPGYEINVAISRRIPNVDDGEIEFMHFDIEETSYENYTIAGIYSYVGYNTIIDRLLGGGGAEGGGTIIDSIFFPASDMVSNDFDILTISGILPKLLVKSNAQELRAQGIENMADNLLALRDRIQIRFFHSYCYILDQAITTMTDEYARAFGSTNLFVPTIVTAVFLTFFSTQITIKTRKEEIAFLRSKGASSVQIIGVFFGEFFIISFIALILSIGSGILLSALIPSFGQNQFFNKSLFTRYLQELELSPYDIEMLSILILGIYLGLTLLNVVINVRKDIHESTLVTQRGQRILEMSIKVIAFILLIAGFLFYLLVEYRKLAETSYNYGFSIISASYNTLYLYIAVIFFSCYFVSLGVNVALKNIKPLYDRIFKSGWHKKVFKIFSWITGFLQRIVLHKSIRFVLKKIRNMLRKIKKLYDRIFKGIWFLIYKNLLRTRKSFLELTFFMVLIVCLLTTTVVIRSTNIHNFNLEEEYRLGADIRIQTHIPVNITQFENQIQSIDGVQNAMGFYSVRASVVTHDVEVYGIDPLKFLQVGRWIDSSFVGISAETALTRLANDIDGVILSEYLVERLRFDIGERMQIQDIRGGSYKSLNVSSIINTAPGLGVAHGFDPKMNRQAIEWVLVNQEIVRDLLGYQNGTLFLVSVHEDADIEYIIEEIKEFNSLTTINPERINPDYIGYFIKEYIPPANSILLVGAIFVNIIGIVYIIISTDFILEQRRRENAVLLALGGRQSKIRKTIVSEIFSFITATFVAGVPMGFIAFFISLTFIKPLLIPREIVPMVIHVNPLFLVVMITSLFIASLIGIIPVLRKQMKYEIVHELRAIV